VNPDDIKNAVQARMSIPDLDVRIYKNAITTSNTISAELDSRLAAQVAERALDMLASRSNMSASGLVQMLQFLSEDHETQMRYTAWRTARRLRGDRV
jgi:hypothetical protein